MQELHMLTRVTLQDLEWIDLLHGRGLLELTAGIKSSLGRRIMRCPIWKKQANIPYLDFGLEALQVRRGGESNMLPRVKALWPRKKYSLYLHQPSKSAILSGAEHFQSYLFENRTGHWTISISLSLISPSVDHFRGHGSWELDRQNNMKRSNIRKSGLDREITSRHRCLNPRRENPEK